MFPQMKYIIVIFLQFMFGHIDGIRRAMIVDYDAHQVRQECVHTKFEFTCLSGL